MVQIRTHKVQIPRSSSMGSGRSTHSVTPSGICLCYCACMWAGAHVSGCIHSIIVQKSIQLTKVPSGKVLGGNYQLCQIAGGKCRRTCLRYAAGKSKSKNIKEILVEMWIVTFVCEFSFNEVYTAPNWVQCKAESWLRFIMEGPDGMAKWVECPSPILEGWSIRTSCREYLVESNQWL